MDGFGLGAEPGAEEQHDKAPEVRELTACDEDTAIQLLRQSHWGVNSAVARSYAETDGDGHDFREPFTGRVAHRSPCPHE